MAMCGKFWLLGAAGAAALGLTMGGAEASFQPITNDFKLQGKFKLESPGNGNGKGGQGGGNFCEPGGLEGCVLNGSLAIAKFEFDDDGTISSFENANGFESVQQSDFYFDFNNDRVDGGDGYIGTGTWTYNADPDDPGITGFAVKAGPSSFVYAKISDAFFGLGDVSFFKSPNNELSNMVFFDSVTPIPLPAAAWMFLGGLGVVGGALKWRRRAVTGTD